MKKNLLLALFVGATANVFAQAITITQADIASIGDTKYQVADTLPDANILPGAAGTAQTWNFSNLKQNICDTFSFVNPSTTPYVAQFPATNIAIKLKISGKPGFYYATKDANEFFMLGIVGDLVNSGSMSVLKFNPGFSLNRFNSTYQSAYNENYFNNTKMVAPPNSYGADSIRLASHKVLSSVVDAWGTIITPSGTHNAIRQYVTEISTDTLWARVPLMGGWIQANTSIDTTHTYRWWANGLGFPVAEMEYDINLNKATKVNFYMANPAIGINETPANNDITAFPNPANEVVTLQLKETVKTSTHIEITDILGNIVATSLLNAGEKNVTISTSSLAEGIYFLRIQETNNQQNHKFIIKH